MYVLCIHFNSCKFLQISPSMYMHLMSLDTDEKLAKTRDMRLPRIVELLDMSETTHQKVDVVLGHNVCNRVVFQDHLFCILAQVFGD